jgi:predicted transcriptional regulator
MSKAVMLSIRPKWCEKIVNGDKTIEVRKTKPKLETPFRCYIYCTLQGCNEFFRVDLVGDVAKWRRGKWADRKGNVIGEFTCDRIYELETRSPGGSYYVKGEGQPTTNDVARQSCLTLKDMHEYLQAKVGYGWHISDLKIYDTPKELDEFTFLRETKFGAEPVTIKRPPQSWCYVEEQE